MKPYYEEAGITIWHGRGEDIAPDLLADVVVTDPPYNLGIAYGQHNDSMTVEEYLAWVDSWWAALPTHRRVVFPGVGNLKHWYRLKPTATACWYKPGATGRANPFQWNEWEPILVWGVTFTGSDVFRCSVSSQQDTGDHPCPKPLQLFRDLIGRLRTKGVILDLFMGSGTTLVAAKQMGRQAVGIELEERFCEIAANRLRQAVMALPDAAPAAVQLSMLPD